MCKLTFRSCLVFVLFAMPLLGNADPMMSNTYPDRITLTITNKPFNVKSHKILNCPTKPCIVDGKIFYGGNGELPKMEVESLVFSKGGKKVYLDVSSIFDTGVTNENIKKHISVEPWSGAYRVVGYFGGGDEPYIAHWLVMSDGSVRNHLSDYESLVSLLFKVKKDFNIQD